MSDTPKCEHDETKAHEVRGKLSWCLGPAPGPEHDRMQSKPRFTPEERAALEDGCASIGTAHDDRCVERDKCSCRANEAVLRSMLDASSRQEPK